MWKSTLVCLFLVASGRIAVAQYNYAEVLHDSLLFYEAERSGKLPADNRIPWRGDSALNDKGQNGEDLTGGYYDAGDHVKFGFPMAYTVTVLAWGYLSNKAAYDAAGETQNLRAALKWGTDYFIKAHVSANELYGQVGDGNTDHAYWGRPEDMTMERPAWKIDTSHPGSDLAGETAAAMAATSIVFQDADAGYSATLLTHAKQLFDFALNYQGKYSDSIQNAASFYNSYDFKDEIVWAAAWLYYATNDQSYLNQAESLYNQYGLSYRPGDFGWDNKVAGVQILLGELTGGSEYLTRAQDFCDYMNTSQQKTPKGLLYLSQWGTLRYAANVAFLCLEAANQLNINPSAYRQLAKSQIDYALGSSGRSYVVGYGNNPPTHEQHRAASCPDRPATCDWNVFNGGQENYQVLTGAMVGGPDQNDAYTDVRSDYVHNEVACDYNAAFQGALAALSALKLKGEI